MAVESGVTGPDDEDKEQSPARNDEDGPVNDEDSPESANGEDEDEDEEGEPRLKYASLTKNLSSLYRNGDITSAFVVGGDKMVVGTHNGNIHVVSLPTFQSLRVYHAHSASISSVSLSPFPPPLPTGRPEAVNRLSSRAFSPSGGAPSSPSGSPASKPRSAQAPLPTTPSNSIHIATSSIDGNVCVASLVDPKDVQLRNFGRPVQAVALSPEYKSDRSYISGGLAGSLVLTTGGQAGRSANATTTGVAAAASGWLGSLGLGANTGTDKVLHSGEGAISTIKWSLSGRYILWVNEQGIKIMRSNLHLESADSGFEWKRMSHIDRPNRPGWEEMASVWKARAEWIDEENLEIDDGTGLESSKQKDNNCNPIELSKKKGLKDTIETAVVGWGGTVWILKIYPGGPGTGKEVGERKIGRVEVATILRTDCIISGISLYTPSLLLVLAYVESEDDSGKGKGPADTPSRKGRHHRQNALQPELRIIDVHTKEEVSADTLTVSRYESLSASDYHLGVLPPSRIPVAVAQRGTFETIGTGIWDATLYPTRIFSSSASVRSTKSSGEKGIPNSLRGSVSTAHAKEVQDVAATQGAKIFVHSPYDCVVAVKRGASDRLTWLVSQSRYQEAWELLNEHPEAVATASDVSETSAPPTPSKAQSSVGELVAAQTSLADFFADTASQADLPHKDLNSSVEKEKRKIGELWLEQLIEAGDWSAGGEVAGKVLTTTSRWEHWIWKFTRAHRFDEITPHIPTFQVSPPLPSLIYEVVLGHYVSVDKKKFQDLLDQWPTDLFDIQSITSVIEEKLKYDEISEGSEDWRILMECLAKLFLANGHYREALRCYIRLQDADTAMSMIRDYHLLDAVADDIPRLILLRISKEQMRTAPMNELEEATSEPIKLLVDEARHGIVQPDNVVTQLEESNHLLYLFFYLRALWKGDGTTSPPRKGGPAAKVSTLAADEGKAVVERFGDTAVELFADYDRPLLMEFLQSSTSYTFSKASAICESRHYTPELIYLLSQMGQTKKALTLIIDELKDVSQAIAFAREQDDPDLWDDLLEYSMSRPKFIQGLLAEVGTAIDPITLVKRVPSGLEIEGLKDGLKKMIREYDLQDSISQGVAKVLQGEVAVGMETLRRGRRKGIKFEVSHEEKRPPSSQSQREQSPAKTEAQDADGEMKSPVKKQEDELVPGHCAGCRKAFVLDESETLVGFACGHVYHLSHLLSSSSGPPSPTPERNVDDDDGPHPSSPRTVGPKVTNARLLKEKIASVGGCKICGDRGKEVKGLS